MNLNALAKALLEHDALTARQLVADALREQTSFSELHRPSGLDATEMAVIAGVVELLAERTGQASPQWCSEIGPAPQPVHLLRAAETFSRLRTMCESQGPEPLRRRRIFAPPDFLTAA